MAGIVSKARDIANSPATITTKATKAREGKLDQFENAGAQGQQKRGNFCRDAGMINAVNAATHSFNCKHSIREVSHAAITPAMKVHSELGAGLLESAYATCLQFELRRAGYESVAQLPLPVIDCGVKLDVGYRLDLLVEICVVVDVKSVDAIAPLHHAQIITYLRLSGKSVGLLINFNVVQLKNGIKRFVSGFDWK
jgi:GxxExxY protein